MMRKRLRAIFRNIGVKKTIAFNVNLDYSGVTPDKRPDQISAYMAPYDGSSDKPAKIADFEYDDLRISWKLPLQKEKSRAHAIYIIEDSHHPASS